MGAFWKLLQRRLDHREADCERWYNKWCWRQMVKPEQTTLWLSTFEAKWSRLETAPSPSSENSVKNWRKHQTWLAMLMIGVRKYSGRCWSKTSENHHYHHKPKKWPIVMNIWKETGFGRRHSHTNCLPTIWPLWADLDGLVKVLGQILIQIRDFLGTGTALKDVWIDSILLCASF